MPELENVEAQKTAGYMSRSRSKYKDSKREQEKLKLNKNIFLNLVQAPK